LSKGQSVPKSSSIAKFNPFLSEDGVIRMQGRLHFADLSYEEKHPIILPKTQFALLLVRFQHLLMKHAGVASMIVGLRNQYWIIGVRRLAKKVKRDCISCKKQDSLPCSQPTASLPADRIKQTPSLQVTGLDHAGPLFCSDFPGKKFYILLFTCGIVRAVHLELMNSLSCEETLLAFCRFAAWRGWPSTMFSDNAKSFVALKKVLVTKFGPVC